MSSQPNVFISYARQDSDAFATKLRKRLETEHPEITLWQDRARMEGGVGWWKQITEALDKVQFLILVMTPGALHSAVSRKEWRYARQQGVCVYPVKGVPDTELDWANMPRWMSKAHFFDLDREWDTFINHLKSPCQAMRVPFMAPDLPEGFVERPTLFEQLMSQLLDRNRENPVTITITLHGAGGLGKTTLAAALCHHDDIITAFDDGILWITLGQKPQIQAGLAKLYAALTGDHPGFVDEEDAAFQLAQKLEDKSCLIVIDDVWDAAHLQPFLRGAARCTRLITTRNFDIAVETKRVNVDKMTLSEAVQMLSARLPTPPGDLTPFRELAQRLGEWPLLLELANGTLRQLIAHGDTLKGALTYLDEKLDEHGVVAFDRRNPLQRNQAITKTIEVSLDLLTPDERERYLELAIFPEDTGVPLRVVSDLWGLKGLGTKELALRLDSLSLLKFNLQVGTIRLHDVMRAYLASKLANPEKLHSKLVDAWGDPHHLTELYAWQWLSYHLLGAGRRDDLRKLLLDFDWLQAKLDRTDVTALIVDYGFYSDVDVELIREAIRLSAHVLAHDKHQLAGQLLGRLSESLSDAVRGLRLQAEQWHGAPWLRPLTSELIPPGGALCFTLSGHSNRVRAVAVTPDGRIAVSASDDCTLKVWNLERGTEKLSLEGHSDLIKAVVVTQDGRQAISVSDDRTLRVWSLETGAVIQTINVYFDWLTALAVTPDGRFAITGSHDHALKVWNLERGSEEHTLEGHADRINAVAITQDGRFAVSASDDQTLRVWNLERWTEEYQLKGHTARVNSLAITTDGRFAVSVSADDTLRVWDLASGREQRTISRAAYWGTEIAVTPDGRYALCASEDNSLKVWDIEQGGEERTFKGHMDWVNAVTVTSDGHYAISASDDRTLKVWDLKRKNQTISAESGRVRSVVVPPDGRLCVTVTERRGLAVWSLDPMVKFISKRARGYWPLAVTPNSNQILAASVFDSSLKLISLQTGEVERTFSGHVDRITAVTLTRDGRRAISASDDSTIRVWNMLSGAEELTISTQRRLIMALAVTPDDRYLMTASEKKGFKVWDLSQGIEVANIKGHTARVNGLVVTSDGQHAISASRDHTLKVWSIAHEKIWTMEHEIVEVHTLVGHTHEVSAVAVTADGRFVISASRDSTLKVWNLMTGKIVATFDTDSPMLACAVGQLGTIVAGDQSGRIHFLRLEGAGQIMKLGQTP